MSRVNDFNRILNSARVKLPGALDAQLKSELFMVCEEFFTETQIWTEAIDMAVNTEDTLYDVAPSMGAVIALHEVKNSDDTPVTAAMTVPGTVELEIAPGQSDTYVATVALKVADPLDRNDLPQFPDWILAKYYGVFLDGLLGRMMATLAKPYSSPQGAVYHTKRFTNGKSQAKIDFGRKNVSAGQNWRFPSFA